MYYGHRCPDKACRIRVLSRRLGSHVLSHLGTREFSTFHALVRAVTLYEEQRLRSVANSAPLRNGKRHRLETPLPQVTSRKPTYVQPGGYQESHQIFPRMAPRPTIPLTLGARCSGCHEVGHIARDCFQTAMTCYGCRGLGHRTVSYPHG